MFTEKSVVDCVLQRGSETLFGVFIYVKPGGMTNLFAVMSVMLFLEVKHSESCPKLFMVLTSFVLLQAPSYSPTALKNSNLIVLYLW